MRGQTYLEGILHENQRIFLTTNGGSSLPASALPWEWATSGCFPQGSPCTGGGSYLIPYFIFVVLIGFTGVIGEMSFGRATRSGPIDAFGIAMERKGNENLESCSAEYLCSVPLQWRSVTP